MWFLTIHELSREYRGVLRRSRIDDMGVSPITPPAFFQVDCEESRLGLREVEV
jgi:hypothetical protein